MTSAPGDVDHILALIDARLAGTIPAGEPAWIAALFADAAPRARGLGLAALPAAWRPLLSRAGVPLAPGDGDGDLRWGRDLEADDGDQLRCEHGRLLLPAAERFAALGSLALRPLREAVARAIGIRLKVGVGVHLRCWEHGALLINAADLPLGGFLIGPRPGARTGIMLAPGTHQVVSW